MADKMSAAEAMNKSIKRQSNHKKKVLIVVGILIIITIILAVITAMQTIKNSKIEQAKAIVSQIDLNTTFKPQEFLDEGDWDKDGILNGQEGSTKTNIQNEDTDGDGICDGDEKKLGTNPTDPDSDKDGMLDGYELMSGTDPLNKISDGTTNDSERKVTIVRKFGEIEAEIKGSPNVADLTIEHLNLLSINSNSSIISSAYDIYSDFEYDELNVKFKVDNDQLSKYNTNINDLTVLRFDSESRNYVKINSTIDAASGTVSAKLDQLGVYVVGIERTANEEPTSRIAFLIDNSGSMYAEYTGYDVEFKRLDFAQALMDKLDGDFTFMVAKFTADYKKLQPFTTDKNALKAALDSIRNGKEVFNGTHSQNALSNCINEFSADSSKKYRDIIVFLTDGESDEEGGKSLADLVKLADDKNITLLTVGLGNAIDRKWLQQLASLTGGKYYSASEANALTDVYKQIQTSFDFDMVSYNNNDDKIQGYSLYNTGFKPEENGFSFRNFRTTSCASVDFGMAVFARNWYLGKLKLNHGKVQPVEESQVSHPANGYDLRSTRISESYTNHKTLKNLSISALNDDFSDAKNYLDFSTDGEVLKVDEKKLDRAKRSGWDIKEYPINASNLDWKRVELLSLDIANSADKIAEAYSKEDAELLNALFTLNSLQWMDQKYEFNLTGGDEGFERLKQLLAEGIPVVTTIDDMHSVNAIGLIQDSTEHRRYILQVYDCNYPGKTREVYITRSPIASCTAEDGKLTVKSTAFEYTAEYEGKQVGINFSDVPT